MLQQIESKSLYDELDGLLNDKPFDDNVFPKLSKVFPTLVGQQIVSVQPMASPQGQYHYIQPVYVGQGLISNLFDEIIKLASHVVI